MPYTEVYDEVKERWVLKKVDALPAVPIRRTLRQGAGLIPMETVCLNCNRTLDRHRYYGGWVACSGGREGLFEY